VDNRAYYDDFAGWYERDRHLPYHRMLDDLEVELVERYAAGKDVLEVGCGTGLILERVASFSDEAWGFDLSSGMLARARTRGLRVAQASVTDIPFPDERFDVTCSFKVLAHVEPIRAAVAELARVTRRGGYLLLEFYNPLSLRYLVKRLKPPHAISEKISDDAVFTRYDTLAAVRSYLPPDCAVVTVRGVRVVTVTALIHRIPALHALFSRLERGAADAPLLRRLGGFMIVVAQKR
jgi:ubiquinone/menaquinone biosynthesis C-methylase UbiE